MVQNRFLKLFRWVVIGASIVMLVTSGHYWNVEQVATKMLFWFDFIIALFSILLVAVLMTDVSDKRKNLNAIILLCAGILSLAFVFG